MSGALKPSQSVLAAASSTCNALASAELPLLAKTAARSGVADLAIALSPRRLAVLRCADRARLKDYSALATMISEGDFIYGAVLYGRGEPPHSPGLIESFHVSQLDQLIARLTDLREAAHEAG